MAPSQLNPQTKFLLGLINAVPFHYSGFLWLPDDSSALQKREANAEQIDLDLSDCEARPGPGTGGVDLAELGDALN